MLNLLLAYYQTSHSQNTENLLVRHILLQQQSIAIAAPRKRNQRVLAARVERVVLNAAAWRRTGAVQGAVVGRADVEAECVDARSEAVGLAGGEVGDLPDVIAGLDDGAGCEGLAGVEGCSGTDAGDGEQEGRGGGGEVHCEGGP
jgi:hypothetical protein